MMGSRESKGGSERDAFSRRARRIVPFGRGVVHRIKQGWSRRQRRTARVEARAETNKD